MAESCRVMGSSSGSSVLVSSTLSVMAPHVHLRPAQPEHLGAAHTGIQTGAEGVTGDGIALGGLDTPVPTRQDLGRRRDAAALDPVRPPAAPSLGAALGIDPHIKRDDCTGLAFGGNKVRQLGFHFGAARARDADTVLVTGAVQSNLVRIAAAAGRRLGMEMHIQIEDRVAGMDETYRSSGNLLLDRVLGATLHALPEGEDEAAADAAMERRAETLAAGGSRPYVIPREGNITHPRPRRFRGRHPERNEIPLPIRNGDDQNRLATA